MIHYSPLAKYFISFGNRQGSPPPFPIPFSSVAATIIVMGGRFIFEVMMVFSLASIGSDQVEDGWVDGKR